MQPLRLRFDMTVGHPARRPQKIFFLLRLEVEPLSTVADTQSIDRVDATTHDGPTLTCSYCSNTSILWSELSAFSCLTISNSLLHIQVDILVIEVSGMPRRWGLGNYLEAKGLPKMRRETPTPQGAVQGKSPSLWMGLTLCVLISGLWRPKIGVVMMGSGSLSFDADTCVASLPSKTSP